MDPAKVAILEDWPTPGDACVVGAGVGTRVQSPLLQYELPVTRPLAPVSGRDR